MFYSGVFELTVHVSDLDNTVNLYSSLKRFETKEVNMKVFVSLNLLKKFMLNS